MPSPKRKARGEVGDLLEELVRLLALQIRLQLPNQNQVILEMHRAGFEPARIGQLLGTTPDVARAAVNKAKSGQKVRAKRDG